VRRKIVFIVAGIVAVLVGGLFGASPASAHNTFIDSSPRDGEILTSTPATWSVTFEKSVPLESASGSIINGDGSRIALASPQHGATDRVIVFTMPSGLNGAISARWRLVGTDGHVISGRVSFTIQDEMGVAPVPTTPNSDAATDDTAGAPDAIRVALRFANFAAIVLLGGLLFAEFDIASGALMTRRGRKLALWAAGILAAAPAAQFLIFANDISTGGEGFLSAAADALSMTAGGMLLLRVVAGLALAWLVTMSLRMALAVRSLTTPICIISVAYLVSLAYGGHSRSQAAPLLGVPVDVAHTAAIAIWLGGLVALILIVVPSVDATGAVNAFSRFSFVAQRAVAVIALTGVIQTVRLHGNPVNLLSNAHGLLLIAKIAAVAVMIRLAARNRETLRRHRTAGVTNNERPRDLLLRATTTEVVFGFGVLAITAILVAVTPG
jgi:copper transport protein